jgi:hypothetical protein
MLQKVVRADRTESTAADGTVFFRLAADVISVIHNSGKDYC